MEEEEPNLTDRLNMDDEGGALNNDATQKTSKENEDSSSYQNKPEEEEYPINSDVLEEIVDEKYLPENDAELKSIEQSAYEVDLEENNMEEEYAMIKSYLTKQYETHENGLDNKDYCPWPWLFSFDLDMEGDCYEQEMDALFPGPLSESKTSLTPLFTAIYNQPKMLPPSQPSQQGQFQYH